MLAVVVLWLATIVGFVPAVLAQSGNYYPYYLYVYLSFDNTDYRLSTFTGNEGHTYIFLHNEDPLSITSILETIDFTFFIDSSALFHFIDVIPLFIVFDKVTKGNFLIGFKDRATGTSNIASLASKNGNIDLLCKDCINTSLTGKVCASRDTKGNRWVTAIDTGFLVSSDLKVWGTKDFLPNVDATVLKSAIEIFPIADDDDASKVTWIIIRKSDTDPSALLYDTFVPDEANPEYKEIGVLDGSTDWFEFAVINGNSTDYRHRKVVCGKRIEYRNFGVPRNIYISSRELSFSGGKLRQLPISTVFPTPTYERVFPSVSFTPGDSVLSHLPPSVALAIEAEMKPKADIQFGFNLFISGTNRSDFAVGLTIVPEVKKIYIARYNWFAAGANLPNDTYDSLYVDYKPDASGIYKVLVLVDTISVEYFVQDGLYVGSIFAFPRSDMKHHEIYASGPLDIINMTVRIFD